MDNLTHTLTGVMMARAGFNKLTPRATLLLAIAANAPDADVVSWLGGPAVNLEWHRAFTHAWLFAPLMALLSVALTKLFSKKVSIPWLPATGVALAGVASHILLDWTNNYGVRFALPFNQNWYRLDSTFVLDPYIWAVLLLAVIAPALSRLVSGEIGARKTSGAGMAWFALIFLVAYDGARILLHERAIQMMSSQMIAGQNPKRLAAFPTALNPFRWRAVVELRDGYWVADIFVNQEFDVLGGHVFFQGSDLAAIQVASQTPEFRSFVKFNQFPLWQVLPEPDGAVKVELYDLRFGDPTAPAFVASTIVTNGKSGNQDFQFGRPRI